MSTSELGAAALGRAGTRDAADSVAVVITTYNHAHFLDDALAGVAAQTCPPDEIIVVDDGSADDPASVVARYPQARLIRQANQGLAAARNTGLNAATSYYILFLDADDLLLPRAIEAGLSCFARIPDAALVYGAHRRVDAVGAPLGGPRYAPVHGDPFAALLQGNLIAMHATVLYRRDRLLEVGGFDPARRRCEDYDVYLRLARDHPVGSHGEVVALYRWHHANMSHDIEAMLTTVLDVHAAHRPSGSGLDLRLRAWRNGRRIWRNYYLELALRSARERGVGRFGRLRLAARLAPRLAVRRAVGAALGRLKRGDGRRRPLGRINLGDLATAVPVSEDFGWDRGQPIDRYYVEGFLARHAADIRGRVIEVGDASYSRRFGGPRIARQDVLHVHAGNPEATIVGSISDPGVLPTAAFDCIVLTQTLHLVWDMAAAVGELHAALRPGGVLLITVPGISQIDRGEWGENWFWSLTRASLRRLLAERFGPAGVEIDQYGNVFAATAFLQGLAVSEVDTALLDVRDDAYPVTVAARAVRQG